MMIHKQEYLFENNKRYESTALGLSRLEFMVRSTSVSSVKSRKRIASPWRSIVMFGRTPTTLSSYTILVLLNYNYLLNMFFNAPGGMITIEPVPKVVLYMVSGPIAPANVPI